MVDLSVRTRRPVPPAGTRPFAAPLDDAARRNDAAGGGADSTPFTSWFDCPEPSLPRYDAVTGPLPRIAPLPDDRAPEAPATPRTEPVPAVPVAAVMFPAEPVAAEPPAGELVWAEPVAVEPVAVEPAVVEPAVVEPAVAEPAVAELPAVEPAAAEPAPAGFAVAEPAPAGFAAPGAGPEVPARCAPVWTEPAAVRPAPAPAPPRRSAVHRALVRATVVAALLTLLAGGATALGLDKTVTLTVDGEDRVLHTYATDVGGALAAAGLAPAAQDRVEPALPTDLADGDHIIVRRARLLTLVEGGGERAVWTTAASVQEALTGLGVRADPQQISAAPQAAIPLTGMSLELRVPRAVTFTDGSARPRELTTTASTVAGLLAEHGIALGPHDVAVPAGDAILGDGSSVQVVRNGTGEVIETRKLAPPERVIEDPKLPRGQRVVVEKGKPGQRTAVMRVQVRNGQEVRREQVRAGGSTPPKPRVVRLGTNDELAAEGYGEPDADSSGQAPTVANAAVWDKLAKCEATGNWSINTGNGYYGGLQFDAGTWKAYGGSEYAALPHQASRAEQISVASKVRDDRGGYGAWPACSRKLGLPG